MTLAVVLSFAVLLLLLTLALLWSSWPGWLKGLLVSGVAVFYFLVNAVVHDLSGWPTVDPMPAKFVLLAVVIDEPTKQRPGALHVWVNPLESNRPADKPRAYTLPYAKDLHALLEEAMKKNRQGVSQVGTSEPKKGKGSISWLRPGQDEQVIKIRDLPVPQLPEK